MEGVPILEVRNISKRFGGVRALDRVNFAVMPNEIHALLGENGAGKSTLMKIISGACKKMRGDTGQRQAGGDHCFRCYQVGNSHNLSGSQLDTGSDCCRKHLLGVFPTGACFTPLMSAGFGRLPRSFYRRSMPTSTQPQ